MTAAAEIFLKGNKAYEAEKFNDAAMFFLQAAHLGLARANHALGNLNKYNHAGMARNIAAAIDYYKKSLQGGFSGGGVEIGNIYYYGLGVPADPKLAEQWYALDASRGNEYAIDQLAALYLAQQQGKKAVAALEKGVAAGFWKGANSLGMIYLYGLGGVPANVAKARKWYLLAADKGHATGAIQAALILKDYEPRDYTRAWKLISGQLTPVALNNKAYMLEHGLGMTESEARQSPQRAMDIYKKAAEMCYGRAMYNIGRLHDAGTNNPNVSAQPVAKDPAVARKWMKLAAEHGSSAAVAWLLAQDGKAAKPPPYEVGPAPTSCLKE